MFSTSRGIVLALVFAGTLVAQAPPAEEKLPDGARLRLGTDRFRAHVARAALSPDGRYLVAGNESGVSAIDLRTGRPAWSVRTPCNNLGGARFPLTPDGKQYFTISARGLLLWDVESGKVVRKNSKVTSDSSMHFSADGNRVAISSEDTVRVLDSAVLREIAVVRPMEAKAVHGTLAPNGKLLATWRVHVRDEQSLQLWDVANGKELDRLATDIATIQSVRFSVDGTRLAIGDHGVIQIWNIATKRLERTIVARNAVGDHLTYSPDGKRIAASGLDGSVQIWDASTGDRLGTCVRPLPVHGLGFRPDGQLLAWSHSRSVLDVWECPSGKLISPAGGHRSAVNTLAFSSDDKILRSVDDEAFVQWDASSGKEIGPIAFRTNAEGVSVSQPSSPLALAPNGRFAISRVTHEFWPGVWDLDAGHEVYALPKFGWSHVAFAANGRAACELFDIEKGITPIAVWELESGRPVATLRGHQKQYSGIGLSPDGRMLVTGAFVEKTVGEEIWAWDVSTGEPISKVNRTANLTSVQFLDHRLYVAVSSHDERQEIRDAKTGSVLRNLEAINQPSDLRCVVSPDRRLIAAAFTHFSPDNTNYSFTPLPWEVVVWEAATGTICHHFEYRNARIDCLAFSNDGRTLATGHADTTILLWDLTKPMPSGGALTATELTELWKTLAEPSAKIGRAALRRLESRPSEAVPFVVANLKPVPTPKSDTGRIARLIAELDEAKFAVREAAMVELRQIGPLARDAIVAALSHSNLTAESRDRLEKLRDQLNKPDDGPEWVRSVRAIEALERIGSKEAIDHLRELANGRDAPPTRAARDALGRGLRR